jgi:hypothetical protein
VLRTSHGLAGFLAEPQPGQDAGIDFQEDMRRRRAALRPPGPVVYEDEERTF